MEKALSDFSESDPKAVLETHQMQRLQRAAFRRCTLSTALAPSSLQYVPAALLTLWSLRQGCILLYANTWWTFMHTLLGRSHFS